MKLIFIYLSLTFIFLSFKTVANDKVLLMDLNGEELIEYSFDKRIIDITWGDNFRYLLFEDGSVQFINNFGYVGDSTLPTQLKNQKVVSLSASGSHTIALTDQGEIYSWIHNNNYYPNLVLNNPSSDNSIKDVYAGYKFSLGLRNDGTVEIWGEISAEDSALVNRMNSVVDIAVQPILNDQSMGFLLENNKMESNLAIRTDTIENVQKISIGTHSYSILKQNGIVYYLQEIYNKEIQNDFGVLQNVKDISSGGGYYKSSGMFLLDNGDVYVNEFGADTIYEDYEKVKFISSGYSHNAIVLGDQVLSNPSLSEESIALSIAPNPVQDGKLQLTGTTNIANYSIYTNSGQLVKSATLQGNQIDVSELDAGVYILVNGQHHLKFLKE